MYKRQALNTAYASNGITGLGDETLTVSDTGSVAASDLNTLDSNTSSSVTASGLSTITGTIAACNSAYGSAGLTLGGDEAITTADTTANAEDLNTLNNYTSGVVNADSITTLTGTIVDINTAFAADAASSATISGLGDQAVEITDTNVLAADLNTCLLYTSPSP